jgi:hypothetical protein
MPSAASQRKIWIQHIQFVPQVVVPDVSVRSLPLHDYTSSELTSADSGAMTYVATFPLSAVYVHRLALFSRGKADASRHCIRFPCQHAGLRLASIRCRFPCYQAGPPLRVSPSSTSFEYFAISISLRSQSAKTYPEMRFGSCAGCMYFIRLYLPFISLANRNKYVCVGRLEDLIHHGLHSFPSRDSPAGQRVIPFSEPYVLPSN